MTLAVGIVVLCLTILQALLVERWVRAIGRVRPHAVRRPIRGSITVLIPARDPGPALGLLLNDLQEQVRDELKMEVLVVDDHSTDGTRGIVERLASTWAKLRWLSAQGEGKKAAITTGVQYAAGEWILVTDADVRCGPHRVREVMAAAERSGAELLLMPVHTTGGAGINAWLQRMEQLMLQAISMGAALTGRALLANGANMAFSKDAFDKVGGYANDRASSGDDMFLLRRMQLEQRRVHFVAAPEAMVWTLPEVGWRAAWRQRLRWAGKMWVYGDRVTQGAALLTLSIPWALLVLAGHGYCAGTDQVMVLLILLAGLIWAIPLWRLALAMRTYFFKERSTWIRRAGLAFELIPATLAFIIYAPVIAIVSIFVRPRWKGRRVRV